MRLIVEVLLIVLCITIGSVNISGQEIIDTKNSSIRAQIGSIVSEIAEYNMLNAQHVGFAGEETDQWRRYDKLSKEATTNELLQLTNHENGVVRCYSFQALAKRKGVDLFPIVAEHLRDTLSISTFSGCIMSRSVVGNYFLQLATPPYVDGGGYRMTEQEHAQMDSILICDKSVLIDKSQAFYSVSPKPIFYDRIKELFHEGQGEALVALAKYQKQEDKEYIFELMKEEKNWYFVLRCIKNFPNNDFYPWLKQFFETQINKSDEYTNGFVCSILFQTITQYKNEASRQLLEQVLFSKNKKMKKEHQPYIWLALTKYPDPVYDGLLERIKLDKHQMQDMQDMLKSDY